MTKGARIPSMDSAAPTTGPMTLPMRNAVPYTAEARPRISGGAIRTMSPIAETVNIVDPTPARPRSSRMCQYSWAPATSAVVTATVSRPVR